MTAGEGSHPIMRLRPWSAAVGTVALALTSVLAGGGTASASPPAPIGPAGFVEAGLGCSFPVLFNRVGAAESADRNIVGRNGEIRVFGGTRLIFTNVEDPAKTLRLPAAGVIKSQAQADGSTLVNVNGSFLVIADGIPGLQDSIYEFIGKVSFVISSNGDITTIPTHPRTIDICAALA